VCEKDYYILRSKCEVIPDKTPKELAEITQKMMNAMLAGNSDGALAIIEEGDYSSEYKDHNSNTPLILAASLDYLDVAAALIEQGAYVNAKNVFLQTPLMKAAEQGNVEMAKILVEAHAQIDQRSKGYQSALMYAATSGSTQIITLLLENGAYIEARDNQGRTALMYASVAGQKAALKLLLQEGAQINVLDDNEQTAKDLMLRADLSKQQVNGMVLIFDENGGKTSAELDDELAA
jgi:ankyrin repeat protein